MIQSRNSRLILARVYKLFYQETNHGTCYIIPVLKVAKGETNPFPATPPPHHHLISEEQKGWGSHTALVTCDWVPLPPCPWVAEAPVLTRISRAPGPSLLVPVSSPVGLGF